MSRRPSDWLVAVCIVGACVFGACAPVPAWRRAALASRGLQPSIDPVEAAQRAHMLGAREASAGGEIGGAAAGCGCH